MSTQNPSVRDDLVVFTVSELSAYWRAPSERHTEAAMAVVDMLLERYRVTPRDETATEHSTVVAPLREGELLTALRHALATRDAAMVRALLEHYPQLRAYSTSAPAGEPF